MKRKILFAILIGLQSLWIGNDVLAMDSIGSSLDKREQRLSSSLKQMFGVNVKIDGDVVTFEGPLDKVETAISKLNDFNQLRQDVIPVSTETILTQACPKSKLTCWLDCLFSLGVQNQGELSNFLIKEDKDGRIKMSYNSLFNQQVANMYLEEIKKQSPYFNWMSRCNKQLIQTIDDDLIVNYDLLTEYLCSIEVQPEPTDSNDIFVSELSLECVLKRLTAAAGSDISLVGTSIPGKYQVRTVMLGNDSHSNGGSIQTIEIVIDKSGSMSGDKIDSVNRRMPIFLQELKNALTEGQSLNVEVFAFNDDISPYNTYNLTHASNSQISWKDIVPSGGTDLTKVGERLKLSSPDEHKVVVAFTDGEHESTKSDLNTSLLSLSALQHEGCFAQPYFCRVGVSSDNAKSYFSKISDTFAGSFYNHDSVEEFCKKVSSKIPYLLESNIPLILTLNGTDVTIRQQDAKPDIHITTQTVSTGDSIMHQGIRRTVVPTEIERLEAQIAALKLEAEQAKSKK